MKRHKFIKLSGFAVNRDASNRATPINNDEPIKRADLDLSSDQTETVKNVQHERSPYYSTLPSAHP